MMFQEYKLSGGAGSVAKATGMRYLLFVLFALAFGLWVSHPIVHADAPAHQHHCAMCHQAPGDLSADAPAEPMAPAALASTLLAHYESDASVPAEAAIFSAAPRGPPSLAA